METAAIVKAMKLFVKQTHKFLIEVARFLALHWRLLTSGLVDSIHPADTVAPIFASWNQGEIASWIWGWT
jgi:hypothetical protein